MTLELITAIATLCTGQMGATYENACQKWYVRCVNDGVIESMRLNQKPDEATILAVCVMKR